ncbi:MAG TPA: hypothetical protein VF044_10790 [Actinomycetota bacterium]
MADARIDAATTEATARRSRRAVLVGALGGIAGAVVGRPLRADAADGDLVRLGRRNRSTHPTKIENRTPDGTTFRARATGNAGVALDGVNGRGTGVLGRSTYGTGVAGESVFGEAVSGHSIEPASVAVAGNSGAGVGVRGGSRTHIGVLGESRDHVAVEGANISRSSPAVLGWAQDRQTGVLGLSTPLDVAKPVASPSDVGVYGVCDVPAGRGVLARSREGRALEARGRVRFSTSGLATVLAGATEVTVAPSFALMDRTKVLATAQDDPGDVSIRWVEVDVGTNAFTIHLSGPATADVRVAWFALE